jgi:hypothetical protein
MFFQLLGIGLVCSFVALPAAHANVVATFEDPGTTSFIFVDTGTNNDQGGDLTAANADIIVSLPLIGFTAGTGNSFSDASYVLTDSGGGALSTTSQTTTSGGFIEAIFEAGELTIKTDIAENGFNAGDTLLTATFDEAVGFFGSLVANDLVGHNVVFSGPALGGLTVTAASFQFASTNIDPIGALSGSPDIEDWTSTTSFTSSATIVPEPLSMLLVGTAAAGLFAVKRRHN